MHQITLFQDKKSKNFLGRGHSPLPRPHPQWGGGHPHPTPHPIGAYGASILGPMALDTRPLSKVLDPPLFCELQYNDETYGALY